jgi:hypothetical protein
MARRTMMAVLACLVLAASLATATDIGIGGPEFSWASHPAQPGEHVILQGEHLPPAFSVDGSIVLAVQSSKRSAKLQLPASGPNHIYHVSAGAASIEVNAPEVSFFHRFDVDAGGEILAYGRSLAFDNRTGRCLSDGPDRTRRTPVFDWEVDPPSGCGGAGNPAGGCAAVEAQLVPATESDVVQGTVGGVITLEVTDASCYRLNMSIPRSATPGRYHLQLKNGLVDAHGNHLFSAPIAESDGEAPGPVVFTVAAAEPSASWPQEVFIADPDYEYRFTNKSGPCSPTGCLIIRRGNLSEALDAAASNGGGIVRLLPGSFSMNATALNNTQGYLIPPRTKVLGANGGRSALVFPAMLNRSQIPTEGFLYGADFQLHDLTIYCGPGKFGTVFSILANSSSALFDRLFVRANPYAGIGSPGGPRWPNNTDHEGGFSYVRHVRPCLIFENRLRPINCLCGCRERELVAPLPSVCAQSSRCAPMDVAAGQDTDVSLGGAIKILGNDTTIRNSDLYLAGHWFIIVGQGGLNARGTIIERNRLSYASGLFYFCGSSRSIISDNLIYGVAVAAQNSAFATCVTTLTFHSSSL